MEKNKAQTDDTAGDHGNSVKSVSDSAERNLLIGVGRKHEVL